jgi:hypothetical protein
MKSTSGVSNGWEAYHLPSGGRSYVSIVEDIILGGFSLMDKKDRSAREIIVGLLFRDLSDRVGYPWISKF